MQSSVRGSNPQKGFGSLGYFGRSQGKLRLARIVSMLSIFVLITTITTASRGFHYGC